MTVIKRVKEKFALWARSWFIPLMMRLFPGKYYAAMAKGQCRFSYELYQALLIAGWYPGRSVPLPDYADPERLHPAALLILHEFGNLTIRSVRILPGFPDYSVVEVSPEWDVDLGYPDEIQAFTELELCHIGMLDFIGPIYSHSSGEVYFTDSETLLPLGTSFDRALEVLIGGAQLSAKELADAKKYKLVPGTRFVFREISQAH